MSFPLVGWMNSPSLMSVNCFSKEEEGCCELWEEGREGGRERGRGGGGGEGGGEGGRKGGGRERGGQTI